MERIIEVESEELLRNIFGSLDENMKLLENEYGVTDVYKRQLTKKLFAIIWVFSLN